MAFQLQSATAIGRKEAQDAMGVGSRSGPAFGPAFNCACGIGVPSDGRVAQLPEGRTLPFEFGGDTVLSSGGESPGAESRQRGMRPRTGMRDFRSAIAHRSAPL